MWDLKTPPRQVVRNEHRLGARVVNRAAEQLAARFSSERIALAIGAALHGAELTALQETLARARDRTTEALGGLHLPHMPSREELLAEARMMFARTGSLDEIVDRAYEMMAAAVGSQLAALGEARS